jgi:hypothetical protein
MNKSQPCILRTKKIIPNLLLHHLRIRPTLAIITLLSLVLKVNTRYIIRPLRRTTTCNQALTSQTILTANRTLRLYLSSPTTHPLSKYKSSSAQSLFSQTDNHLQALPIALSTLIVPLLSKALFKLHVLSPKSPARWVHLLGHRSRIEGRIQTQRVCRA